MRRWKVATTGFVTGLALGLLVPRHPRPAAPDAMTAPGELVRVGPVEGGAVKATVSVRHRTGTTLVLYGVEANFWREYEAGVVRQRPQFREE